MYQRITRLSPPSFLVDDNPAKIGALNQWLSKISTLQGILKRTEAKKPVIRLEISSHIAGGWCLAAGVILVIWVIPRWYEPTFSLQR
jgi:hypothetical protein